MSIPSLPDVLSPELARAWRREYQHGACHAFTVAMAGALAQDVAWRCDLPGGRAPRIGFHSCVALPDGGALDVTGVVTLEQLRTHYRHAHLTWTRVPVAGIAVLSEPEDDELVLALEVASRLPDFPHREAAWQTRWRDFADVTCPYDPATELPDA